MIKFRRKELLRLYKQRPYYNNLACDYYNDLRDIRVEVRIVRDASFPSILSFVLDEWEYTPFMSMQGTYEGKDKDGVVYKFTFLPSDYMIIISDNYEELNTLREQKRQAISDAYQKTFENARAAWKTKCSEVSKKPIIYWEPKA